MHLHQHNDHFHIHEHFHGGRDHILISTIGLVLHSIADGVAVGVTLFRKNIDFNNSFVVDESSSDVKGLGILIFVAILLHKGPAAIGFGTFLHHEGVENATIVKHLLVIITPFYMNIGIYFNLSIIFLIGLLCVDLI